MKLSIIIHDSMPNNDMGNHLFNNNDNIEVLRICFPSVPESFNSGLNKAKGDFIWFLEGIDKVDESFIIFFTSCFDGNSEIYTFDYTLVYSDGYQEANFANTYHEPSTHFIPMLLQNRYAPFLCNKIFKKDLLIKNNISFNDELSCLYEKLFLISLYHLKSINTQYINLNIVRHPVKAIRSEYHNTFYPSLKESLSEYPIYYKLVKYLVDNKYNTIIEQEALEFKRYLCIYGYLNWNQFNSFCPTSLSLIWKPIFTIKQSIKLTINYIKYLL